MKRAKKLIEEAHQHEAQELPPGWKNTTLGEILNPEQLHGAVDIINRIQNDDIALTQALKKYLVQFSADLEKKGVVPDYLAYLLTHLAPQLRRAAAKRN